MFIPSTFKRPVSSWKALNLQIGRAVQQECRDLYSFPTRRSSDLDFLTSNKVWIATDRSRARRCVEACVYGTLDFVGYPRFPAPVEFIAAVIAYYVHPVNIQTACLIMEGAEFTENII